MRWFPLTQTFFIQDGTVVYLDISSMVSFHSIFWTFLPSAEVTYAAGLLVVPS